MHIVADSRQCSHGFLGHSTFDRLQMFNCFPMRSRGRNLLTHTRRVFYDVWRRSGRRETPARIWARSRASFTDRTVISRSRIFHQPNCQDGLPIRCSRWPRRASGSLDRMVCPNIFTPPIDYAVASGVGAVRPSFE